MQEDGNWYIEHKDLGLFIGEFLGMGIFTNTDAGIPADEVFPVSFPNEEDARKFISSWKNNDVYSVIKLKEEELRKIMTKYINKQALTELIAEIISSPVEPLVSQSREPSFGQWTDAKQLPPETIRVICYCEGGHMEIGYIYEYHYCRDKGGDTFAEDGYKVIKWMPLPKP